MNHRSQRRGSSDVRANNEKAEKHLGLSFHPFSYILTQQGLNLSDGMKETITALICTIIAILKRKEGRLTKQDQIWE